MNTQINCPICKQICTNTSTDPNRDITFFECPTCGEYKISPQANRGLEDRSPIDKTKLSAYLRERYLQKEPIITLVSEEASKKSFDTPVISADDILSERFPSHVSDRLDRILKIFIGVQIFREKESDSLSNKITRSFLPRMLERWYFSQKH